MADTRTTEQILNENLEAIQKDLGATSIKKDLDNYYFKIQNGDIVVKTVDEVKKYVAPKAEPKENGLNSTKTEKPGKEKNV